MLLSCFFHCVCVCVCYERQYAALDVLFLSLFLWLFFWPPPPPLTDVEHRTEKVMNRECVSLRQRWREGKRKGAEATTRMAAAARLTNPRRLRSGRGVGRGGMGGASTMPTLLSCPRSPSFVASPFHRRYTRLTQCRSVFIGVGLVEAGERRE